MKHKALFLDRDGIINIDYGYVHSIDSFKFIDGIFELTKYFSNAGYLIFVITNQSGICRGYYTEDDFLTVTAWMVKQFSKYGIAINGVYHCPHTPDTNCHCRKPNTGMVEQACLAYNIDLGNSWVIGDKQSDIDLAQNAKIGYTIAIGEGNFLNTKYHFASLADLLVYIKSNSSLIPTTSVTRTKTQQGIISL
ncbi:MAG: D-glycero-beta-D-manno-heptose 1,7-bisphosphate 7-phosphatase [Sulfurovum sp.]|nr:D-glycero-beta-D-manno-heptose 1,7-bisphosphate 7-phosphatase [Sulfurovum sp.]MCB4744211.1 D-glycero-beta-D-manno-heptose 1,7-bisphosphate 7-phosphatase [Sulfurovum sp.]MCB4745573.1 D-glycero-beta-D-manno-heptose 1,7-bisphosphate 7-phosphatase [Sulfurovum sp.]MCB4749212.1 D-glycero-beta-D-manno-heptose 1,7-bisphosphate 7-phosphatase [Sulfurovum sp.]MCB4753031.1 D-glycero-beta-D-manno-heptose 1,7-bisphosphate 7-phosphatase [Sulfurovum sp.]